MDIRESREKGLANARLVQDRYRARLIESVVICLPSQKLAYGSLAEKRSRQANDSVSVVAMCLIAANNLIFDNIKS